LTDAKQLFEKYLADKREIPNPQNLYEPIDYVMSAGGKRIRPVMLVLAHQLFSKSTSQTLIAAEAIEVFHNFTLVHDDMMDQDDTRRGRPTVHKQFSDSAAILSGDMMLIQSYQLLAQLDVSNFSEILNIFNQTAQEVCEGQQFDMDFERQEQVSITKYVEMIRLKTAVLQAAALQIGALLGGASASNAQSLYDYGIEMGLAFQIMDDWLDTFGDEALLGKRVGSDIARNKKTFLYLKALETASAGQKAHLQLLYELQTTPDHPKVAEVTLLFKELGIDKTTRDLAEAHYQKGLDILNAIDVSESSKKPLLELSKLLMKRKH